MRGDTMLTHAPTLPWRAPAGADAPPLLTERYFDHGLIGAGGMGEIRRVWDRRLERTLAMKILRWSPLLDEEACRRFLIEASISAELQHPGIVAVHEQGWLSDGRPWFTLDEVRGRTLGELIVAHERAEDRRVRLQPLIRVLHAVCHIVAFTHRHGVVHRDLKPQNIMIDHHGGVLVLDWGLATRMGVDLAEAERGLTGTPGYISPERLHAARSADPCEDIYSLGCMLYEILTGRRPYGGTPSEALERLAREAPLPVALATQTHRAAGELCALCEQAMARESALRPDAERLALGLRSWLERHP
ncbi:serine/threonine-protein kinase [Nannocystis punicea]|uniref:Serine/threonine-protein kinase n=1 Tax=Nannocystis punicea TaxID=2995304 RepID=A0ABY7H8S3_9BACT|nr:serine/threonine-protein kinase [Nannocystis poenicansa]WAS95666.1 serine/threonine-protein kinase [Nannocystis poenicansa]